MCKITIKSLLSGDNEVERQTDGHIEDINSADEDHKVERQQGDLHEDVKRKHKHNKSKYDICMR